MFLEHQDDAVGAAGDIHEAIFENDTVRVLRIVMPPGHKTVPHWHPKNITYVIAPGRLRITLASGEVKEVELVKDSVGGGEGVHAVENIGATEIRVVQIEFKR